MKKHLTPEIYEQLKDKKTKFVGTLIQCIKSDTGITLILHGIGYYPDLVIVQLKLSSGYISESQGAVFKSDAASSLHALCGVVMAYDRDEIRVWPVTKTNELGNEAIFCVSDGWGKKEFHYNATVYVQAWRLATTDIRFSQTDARGSGITIPSSITMSQSYDIDNHIFLVQSQAISGNNANFLFEGAGTALSDGTSFFGEIGAVVYAYNSDEVNLWYPGSDDYIIYVGGSWGNGTSSQNSTSASVTVKVIRSNSALPGCGCSGCTSDWNALSVSCDCSTSSGKATTTSSLKMAKNSTNRYRRSLTSADDPRESSRYIGYGAILLLIVMGGVTLFLDVFGPTA